MATLIGALLILIDQMIRVFFKKGHNTDALSSDMTSLLLHKSSKGFPTLKHFLKTFMDSRPRLLHRQESNA